MRIAYVCPTYEEENTHAYTMTALESFFDTTDNGLAIVVDDNSRDFDRFEPEIAATPRFAGQEIVLHHFDTWGGLTRSWNKGLEIAARAGADFVCPSNNDVIFTAGWQHGLLHALESGYSMAGPLSNAPGITARGRAEVWRYVADYRVTDDRDYLDAIAAELRVRNVGKCVEARVNGFLQFARTSSFEAGRFDGDSYYRPRNDFVGGGRRNPTPLMTYNEDELQGRWGERGARFAVATSSFVFHYRGVSRGEEYLLGRWYRRREKRLCT